MTSVPVGNFPHHRIGDAMIYQADCLDWLAEAPADSVHAIVTDPPYGIKEYDPDQLQKRASGRGGIWRIPPSFDGSKRSPLPRFTALTGKERRRIREFFTQWGAAAVRVLRPGGHLFIACNAFISQLVFEALVKGGLEFRGEVIRLVRTLRGGDRPKNAEAEWPDVCSMPRGRYEPWGLFRKPTNLRLADCLRRYGTGGLRRLPDGPFCDVIESEKTPKAERRLADHPSLKPQSFMRHLVYAALPLGDGVILDPFMGHGSTIAAAQAMGLQSIGIERQLDCFEAARGAIPKLAAVDIKPAFVLGRANESEADETAPTRKTPDGARQEWLLRDL